MPSESLQLSGAAFDEMAAAYDTSFTTTRLGSELRKMVWQRLALSLPERGRIIEIGCGTGEDAIRLAQRGYDVLATDASRRMLDIAREKALRAGCRQRIEFAHLPMQQLARELEGERFDGVFSNFGVFNCTSAADELATDLARLLQPGAALTGVIMGRYVPWEWAWFLLRLDWRRAFRRLPRSGTLWRGLRIHYPTPKNFAKSLSPYFDQISAHALGLVLPPSYASAWLNERPRVFGMLAKLERAAHRHQSLAAIADHYIIQAHRNSAQPDA
ncbi:MAG TPA: class I SAM-dependent methyltransferase [Gammaproteobacteria bacterium]|nr:class I SAM-dependent methyltransferase [Gammaproteobacteria bacterium]